MEIEEALKIVEGAGFTVIDDRRLRAYYKLQELRLEALVNRAIAGDTVAGEDLLRHIGNRPDLIAYSASLIKFMGFIVGALLSRKKITTTKNPSKRLKNPLLVSVLKTDGRNNYEEDDFARKLKALFDNHKNLGNHECFETQQGVSKIEALIEHMALAENITKEKLTYLLKKIQQKKQLKKYLSTPKT